MTDQGIVELPEILLADGRPPIVEVPDVTSAAAGVEWLTAYRTGIGAALHRHGALMLRGLRLADQADFAAARDVLIEQRATYREKATPRSDFGDDVFSSTDLPPTQAIRLHNENSYTLDFPGVLLFGCLAAPDDGGATTVADCREILDRIPDHIVARFRADGWQLRRGYQPNMGLPWTTAFGTRDRADVEDYCRRSLIGWSWTDNGGLRTGQLRPAVVRHPRTGDEVWFNHVVFWNIYAHDADMREILIDSYGEASLPFQTCHGDGSPIAAGDIAEIDTAYAAALRRESWEAGDLLLVDNILACHGREAYTGNRRIVVAMGEPIRLADCVLDVEPAPGSPGEA